MNKSSNRQWIVVGLALGAVFMVYQNVVKPLYGNSPLDVSESVAAPADTLSEGLLISNDRVNSAEPALGAARVVNKATLNHTFDESRDPFMLPNQRTRPLKRITKTKKQVVKRIASKKQPELTAVMLGPVQKYALVDGEIVSEGQLINGVRVVKIAKNNVLFEGHEGAFSLELNAAQIGNNYE